MLQVKYPVKSSGALLTLLSTLRATTLVDFILVLLGLVVKIPTSQASGAANGCTKARVARHGPNCRATGSANSAARQSALLGCRHSGTSAERQAEYKNGSQ